MNPNQAEKDRHERYVAEKFCESLGERCTLLKKLDPPAPDFLLTIDGKQVGLEIARIRNSNAYDIWSDYFRGFELYVQRRDGSDGQPEGLICVWSRVDLPRKKSSSEFWKYPPEKDYESCYGELIKLSECYAPKDDRGWPNMVYFEKDHPGDGRDANFAPDERPRLRWIKASEYPTLYKYFSCFKVWGGAGRLGVVYSEFQKIELDELEIERVIGDKIEKLSNYQSCLKKEGYGKCPVWLLLYSEGCEPSRIIPKWDSCTERIKEIYHKAAGGKDNHFREVWWGTDVMPGKSLVEGQPPSTSFQRLV